MPISDVKQVVEVTTTQGTDTLNEYLKLGWVLIGVSSMTTDHREYSGPMIKYSLGWPGPFPVKQPADPYGDAI